MENELKPAAARFQETIKSMGYDNQVVELPASTRTAKEAADAIGCKVEQIAKSIVFRMQATDLPILIVACGANRIEEAAIEAHIDNRLGKADATFVKATTGFAIGGVPPFGHEQEVLTLIDEDLFQFDTIWAAAGHAMAVFELTPAQLEQMTGAKRIQVT